MSILRIKESGLEKTIIAGASPTRCPRPVSGDELEADRAAAPSPVSEAKRLVPRRSPAVTIDAVAGLATVRTPNRAESKRRGSVTDRGPPSRPAGRLANCQVVVAPWRSTARLSP
jgi:hypothetical protein